jgi:multidrug efflux pump subunit AcrA (membrane-fusion protein)
VRKWLITGAAVLMLAAAGGIAIGRRAHKPKPSPVAPAPRAMAESTDAGLNGRVQPRTSVRVAAPMEGTLESFFVDVNQEVYQGQLVGRIRSNNLEAAQQQAQLALDTAQARVTTLSGDQLVVRLEASRAAVDQSRARADVDRLEKIYQRQKGLWEAGATARLTFEKAEKDYTDARATVERADTVAK